MNRALAICLRLRDADVDARIVTNSPFAEGLAALSRCPIVQIDGARWEELARQYVAEVSPRSVVTDTFPYGLRGEWKALPPPARLVHVARRLLSPFPIRRQDFAAIIQAEPLTEAHASSLHPDTVLPGPILLPPGRIPTAVPPDLDRDDLTLVVHSGPEEEMLTLTSLAEPPFAVISPWSDGHQYYPATNLFAQVRRIITGAGYNSMADALAHRDRHTAVPFHRRYDDQHARTVDFFKMPGDGTAEAVDAILGAL